LLADSIPVERVAQQIITTPDDVVFVSGSIVEGFGNENSDLDLFLVRAGGEVTPDPRLVLATVGLGETYIDYEVYNEANLAALAALINGASPDDFRAVWRLPLSRIDLYYRVVIAQPAYNAAGLAKLQRDFERETVAAVLATWAGLRCVVALEQADELLARGDGRNASVVAQSACGYALDSYLATQGEAYPNLKWRFEKIKRRFGRDSRLYCRAWELKAPGYRGVPQYMEAVRGLCDELGMRRYASWGLGSLRLSQTRDARLFRVAGRYYLVQNRTFIYELSRVAKYAWEALDGSITRSELVGKLAQRWRLSHEEAGREVADLLQALKKHNLVRES
jgi:predicted nucleotidyltransferase